MKQSDLSNPIALAKIIAESNANNIPVNATGSSYASQAEGFPKVTMIPEEQGGEAPHGKDFNGFLRILTSHMFNIQNGTPETFNASVSSAIGGYPKNSLLWLIDDNNSRLLKSTKDDNTDNFLTTPSVIGTSWVNAFPTKQYVDSKDTNLQSQITTNANNIATKANNNAVVHLTGDETITGAKTFTQNVVIANTNITKGTNPSSKTYCSVELTDKNGRGTTNRVGVFESAINTNGDIETLIGAYKYDNNSTTVGKISVIYPKTGNPYTFAPASDVAGSIVTTVSKSKASNGYFQLGNGIIVNWFTGTLRDQQTWTFKKAFNNTNYAIICSPVGAPQQPPSDTNWMAYAGSKANTNAVIRVVDTDNVAERTATVNCIAFGY